MLDVRATLLDCLAKFAYEYDAEKKFLLASGAYSDEYLDCRRAFSRPEAMSALGPLVWEQLQSDVAAVGGLTMGSDPVSMSACFASSGSKHPVRWFTVRKEPKAHGQKKLVEGDLSPGDTVAVVDDVVTSGASTIKAVQACREFGLRIAQVLVVVDREQSAGMDNIRQAVGAGVPVAALFTKSEIKARWAALRA